MASILRYYDVRLIHGTTTVDITPVNDRLDFDFERRDGDIFYRRKLNTKLVLSGADFDFVLSVEESPDRCEPFSIEIDYKGVLYFEGRVNINKVSFDLDRCRAEMSVDPFDDYTCIKDAIKRKTNLLKQVLPSTTVSWFTGILKTTVCSDLVSTQPSGNNSSCLNDPGAGWVVKKNTISEAPPEFLHETTWVREESTDATQPPGDGWTFDTNDNVWYRSPKRQYDADASESDPTALTNDVYIIIGQGADYDTGRRFNDIVEHLFDIPECEGNFNVVSNFFGINPDGIGVPNNDVYNIHAPYGMRNIHVFQKSDLTFLNADTNASVLEMTLEEWLFEMTAAAEVFYMIIGGNLYVEHISYFETVASVHDLIATHPEHIKRKNQYRYNNEEIPRQEIWLWLDPSEVQSEEFVGDPIVYDCPGNDDNKEIKSKHVTTDIESIFANPQRFGDVGMVWIACYDDADNNIIVQNGYNDNQHYWNGHLSRRNLHNQYCRHNRLTRSGLMNEEQTTFESFNRTKIQTEITIPLMDIDSFDPTSEYITELGQGKVKKARIEGRDCKLTLTLAYE